MSGFHMARRAWERSWIAGANVADGWGPGPWDDDDLSWTVKSRQVGDLRSWQPGLPTSGSRLIAAAPSEVPKGQRAGGTYDSERPRNDGADGVLRTFCWCQRSEMIVAIGVVTLCQTVTCGRVQCHPEGLAA